MTGSKPDILSPRATRAAPAALVALHKPSLLLFDACHIGVVLRAIGLVEVPLALVVMFSANSFDGWLGQFAMLTGVALIPLLAWLIASCLCKYWLNAQTASVQWGFALLLGWLCGLLGFALYRMLNFDSLHPGMWLASGLSGVALASLLTSILVMRQRAQTPATEAAKMAELQSRIRPHFLFNTLNSAIALVRQDPAKAESMLEDLSDLFHHALKDSNSTSTLEKEIEIARQYLRIEGTRFDERLRVTWTIDDSALEATVPPLLLQPLVENAIKHGVEPSTEGGEIHILVRRKADQVFIRISNTVPSTRQGHVLGATAGNGIALSNVRARLRLMHDVNAEFKTQVRDGRYEVGMSLPAQPLMGRHFPHPTTRPTR